MVDRLREALNKWMVAAPAYSSWSEMERGWRINAAIPGRRDAESCLALAEVCSIMAAEEAAAAQSSQTGVEEALGNLGVIVCSTCHTFGSGPCAKHSAAQATGHNCGIDNPMPCKQCRIKRGYQTQPYQVEAAEQKVPTEAQSRMGLRDVRYVNQTEWSDWD